MTPDEKKPDDEIIMVEGFMFVCDRELYKSLDSEITIDYRDTGLMRGFKVYR